MTSFLRIDQAGLANGTPGVSRTDGQDGGQLVTLRDMGPPSATRFQLLWKAFDDTTAQSSLVPTGNPKVWTFSPTATRYGSYLIELIRDEGLPTETRERRVFGVRLPTTGLLIPALNERGVPTASLVNHDAAVIEATDNNATDYADADLNTLQYAAWWRAMQELYLAVESGGGGGAVDSVFGRTGVVVAVAGDYDSDLVDNVSTVPGATVSDALDNLETDIEGAGNEALRKQMRWVDDFDFNSLNTIVPGGTTVGFSTSKGAWALNQFTGTGNLTAIALAGEVNAPGILRLTTDNNTTSYGTMYRGQLQGGAPFNNWVGAVAANQIFRVQLTLRCSSVAGCGFRFFLSDGFFPDAAASTIAFMFDTAVGAQVQTLTRAASVGTTKNVGAPSAGSFVRYTIQQTVIGTIEFYINGLLVSTHSTGENVPGAQALSFGFSIFNRTAAIRNFDVDFAAFESQDLAGLPPSPAIAAFVSYAVREDANVFNVGKASWMYPTIHAALAAINTGGPPAANNKKIIKVWPGEYVSTTPYVVPGFVAIKGCERRTVVLVNNTGDMFTLAGSDITIESFAMGGDPGAAFVRVRNPNQNLFSARDVLHFGVCNFYAATGATWINAEFDNVLLVSGPPSGYLVDLNNSGGSRFVDVWIKNCFWDNFFLGGGGAGDKGGCLQVTNCLDVRVMWSELRAAANNAGEFGVGINMLSNSDVRVENTYIGRLPATGLDEKGMQSTVGCVLNVFNTDAANSTPFLAGTVIARNSFLA